MFDPDKDEMFKKIKQIRKDISDANLKYLKDRISQYNTGTTLQDPEYLAEYDDICNQYEALFPDQLPLEE